MWEVMLILTGLVFLCFILFELLNRYIIYVIADYNNYIWSTVYWANEESSGSPKNWDGRNLWWTRCNCYNLLSHRLCSDLVIQKV